jgi:hypothetical protein
MDHDHGHWFVIGVILAGVLMAGGAALRAALDSMGSADINPWFVIALAALTGGICTGKWWLDR